MRGSGARRAARVNGRIPSALAALLATLAVQPSMALDWGAPWEQPHDAAAAASQSDEYAWRLFVALNWPADLRERTADRAAAFGADRPVLWEAWQSAGDVYLDGGKDPGPWTRGDPTRPPPPERRFETFSLKDLPNLRHVVDGKMVPLVDPLEGARRLAEIRMNKIAFEYLRARELYNVEGQLRAVAGGGVHFPPGATEIKAKWRPIRSDERARYHIVEVRTAGGAARLYGLTALHIVSKDLPQWFWATFEHIDNPKLPDADKWQLPSSDHFACRGEAPDCNRMPRGIGLEQTVWQYYRLRGTLTRYADDENRPLRLANSELEAGLQQTSSCVTCHSRSAIGVVAGAPMRLPIFDAAPHESAQDALERRGYVGIPRAEWFKGSGGGVQPLFQPLDFVWSLSKAQPRRGS
jgi:hypothetical protein